MTATLEELDRIASRIALLRKEMQDRLWPNGQPDYIAQEDWENIKGD